MSKSKDRARAESGLIFRNGSLVRKEDWYRNHPTKETQMVRLEEALKAEFAKKSGLVVVKGGQILDPKDSSAVLAEAEPYYCTKCKITHRRGKIHQEHHQYASPIVVI